jgi:hypothetical protein
LPEHIHQFWQAYFYEEDPSMYPQTLHPSVAELWQRYGAALCPAGYALGGGTAITLLLGHRQSDNPGFLTLEPQDPALIVSGIQALDPDAEMLDRSRHRIHWRIQGVKVSYLWQQGVRIEPGPIFQNIPLAPPAALAVLKRNTIANRGARKDFINLYALLQSGWALAGTLDAAAVQPRSTTELIYCAAWCILTMPDKNPNPAYGAQWSWPEIRQTLEQQVYAYLRRTLQS